MNLHQSYHNFLGNVTIDSEKNLNNKNSEIYKEQINSCNEGNFYLHYFDLCTFVYYQVSLLLGKGICFILFLSYPRHVTV